MPAQLRGAASIHYVYKRGLKRNEENIILISIARERGEPLLYPKIKVLCRDLDLYPFCNVMGSNRNSSFRLIIMDLS